ncbi:hypothetical protein BDZ45DRAFT_725748 [Acephala macrosclerotiorum]|nr:hypothetical protein BDZ45DRAFT_725748 [Acephala macrosclerotiorum]
MRAKQCGNYFYDLTTRPKSTSRPASDDYLNKTILDWYYNSPSKYSLVWESVNTGIDILASRWTMIQANPWTIPTAIWNSYESFIVDAISSYNSILWGSAQDAVNTFGDSPWTDDGYFWKTCTDQLYASSSAYVTSVPAASRYFDYTAHPPCCGWCGLDAKEVKLAYWPIPAPTPGVSTLVDASGTT